VLLASKKDIMRIAIPLSNGQLAAHFGHCEQFALLDVDLSAKKIVKFTQEPAPDHEPGLLPRWLHERGATVVIAGGMGSRARGLFEQAGIEVVTGVESRGPEAIAQEYLNGSLITGANCCDH
jgi:ATP-binding protein involved in chromosome partitioning